MKFMMALALGITAIAFTANAELTRTELNRRMDCRFQNTANNSPRFCYVSALYHAQFQGERFRYDNVRFGVGCGSQTIFDDAGVFHSREILGERLLPSGTEAPQIELEERGAPARIGSYAAKLQLPSGELYEGTCYVADISLSNSQPGLIDPVLE